MNPKHRSYIQGWRSSYYKQALVNITIICYDSNIYVFTTLLIHVADWHNIHIEQPGGGRISNIIKQVC